MKHLSIILKFLVISTVFSVFAVGTAIYAVGQFSRIASGYDELINGGTAASLDVAQADHALAEIDSDIGHLLMATMPAEDSRYKAALEASRRLFSAKLTDAIRHAPSQKTEILALKSAGEALIQTKCGRVIEMATASGTVPSAAQAAFMTQCSPYFRSAGRRALTLMQSLRSAAGAHAAALFREAHNVIALTFGVILGGLVLALTGGFFAVRSWFVLPLKTLQSVMLRLSSGDLTVVVSGTERRDEVGGMARAVQVFKEAGLDKVRLEKASAVRDDAEAQRRREEAERDKAVKQQTFVVESVAAGLEKLAAGTLTYRIDDTFAPEYERLRTDFNVAMERLQEAMTVIVANTAAIRSGAGEISSAADDLSRRTEQQAASLEQTAAALDEITATVRKTAEGATHARDAVGLAHTDAQRSGTVVSQAVAAMSEIEASSQKISNIIGVIDEIAFQTNLLALNAGVEAARAGDAGRGFAVVASEVRALAQRSADAAKEIKSLILDSGQQVVSGVDLVGQTGKALERIVEQISEINGIVVQIAASAQEQATGLHEVNTAVNQMDQVTQQNAAMVEESTAAGHSLAHETDELATLIGRFEIGELTKLPVRPPPKKSTARAGHAAVRPAVPVPIPVRPPLEPADNESWEDF